jgi:hypothetical protein
MFVLSKSGSYSWPVEIETPSSGGKHEKHSFDAEFKRLPQSKVKELLDSSVEENSDKPFVKAVMIGWKGIADEKGQEIPFSQEALEDLLEVPQAAKQIVFAYMKSIGGSKVKN